MGGLGSGNWDRHNAKSTTDDYDSIDINYLSRNNLIRNGAAGSLSWSIIRFGEKHVGPSIGYRVSMPENDIPYFRVIYSNTSTDEDFDYKIYLTSSKPNYGGRRIWFLCPVNKCNKRVGKLYLTNICFACRSCLDLAYSSQNEDLHYRLLHRAQKIHQKLGGSGCTFDPVAKPKGMHWKTYNKLIKKMNYYDNKSSIEACSKFKLLDKL